MSAPLVFVYVCGVISGAGASVVAGAVLHERVSRRIYRSYFDLMDEQNNKQRQERLDRLDEQSKQLRQERLDREKLRSCWIKLSE
jgi:hypothetical protein